MPKCPNCNEDMPKKMRFCGLCGTDMQTGETLEDRAYIDRLKKTDEDPLSIDVEDSYWAKQRRLEKSLTREKQPAKPVDTAAELKLMEGVWEQDVRPKKNSVPAPFSSDKSPVENSGKPSAPSSEKSAENAVKQPALSSEKPPVASSGKSPVENTGKPPIASSGKSPVENTGKSPIASPGKSPVENIGKPPIASPGKPSMENTGKPSIASPGKSAVENTGKPPIASPGKPPVENTGKPPIASPGKPSVENTGKPSIASPGKSPMENTGKPSTQSPGKTPVENTGKPSVVNPGKPIVGNSARTPIINPVKTTAADTAKSNVPASVASPIKSTVPTSEINGAATPKFNTAFQKKIPTARPADSRKMSTEEAMASAFKPNPRKHQNSNPEISTPQEPLAPMTPKIPEVSVENDAIVTEKMQPKFAAKPVNIPETVNIPQTSNEPMPTKSPAVTSTMEEITITDINEITKSPEISIKTVDATPPAAPPKPLPKLPDVTKLTKEKANAALSALNVDVILKNVNDDVVLNGIVVEQDPLPGAEVVLPMKVTLSVSVGTWSNWQRSTFIPDPNYVVESKTVYRMRSRDKFWEEKVSDVNTMVGFDLYDTVKEYSNWEIDKYYTKEAVKPVSETCDTIKSAIGFKYFGWTYHGAETITSMYCTQQMALYFNPQTVAADWDFEEVIEKANAEPKYKTWEPDEGLAKTPANDDVMSNIAFITYYVGGIEYPARVGEIDTVWTKFRRRKLISVKYKFRAERFSTWSPWTNWSFDVPAEKPDELHEIEAQTSYRRRWKTE